MTPRPPHPRTRASHLFSPACQVSLSAHLRRALLPEEGGRARAAAEPARPDPADPAQMLLEQLGGGARANVYELACRTGLPLAVAKTAVWELAHRGAIDITPASVPISTVMEALRKSQPLTSSPVLLAGPDHAAKAAVIRSMTGSPPRELPPVAYGAVRLDEVELVLVAAPEAPADEEWPDLLRGVTSAVVAADLGRLEESVRIVDVLRRYSTPHVVAVDPDRFGGAPVDLVRSELGLDERTDLVLARADDHESVRYLLLDALRAAQRSETEAA